MYINKTKEDSIQAVNDMLEEHGISALSDSEVNDWDIQGGETNAELQEYVNDYVSEIASENAAAKQEWRYNV